jgi:hypothetical protein
MSLLKKGKKQSMRKVKNVQKPNENLQKQNTVKYLDIETPTNVKEFRNNLLKYYFSIGRKLYVSELGYIDVDRINSMEDISKMRYKKDGVESFKITPLVIQTTEWESFVRNNSELTYEGLNGICMKWWLEPANNKIYKRDLINENNPMEGFEKLNKTYGVSEIYWKEYFKEGNDNFYEFWIKTLGKYGGYSTHNDNKFNIDKYINEQNKVINKYN